MINSFDSIWGSLGEAKQWLFYDVSKVTKQPWLKRPAPAKLLSFEITIDTS